MQFAVQPTSVPYSTESVTSIVDVTVTLTNDTAAPVACGSATFTFPQGGGIGALTADPSTITTAPGDSTPWAISSDGGGRADALILPPAVGLASGESVSFTFGSIIVNTAGGSGPIDVSAIVNGAPVIQTVVVQKDRPAQPSDGLPVISKFTVAPEQIALGGTAIVSWTVANATTCILDPGPTTLPSPITGQLPLTVSASTVFHLVALSAGGIARDQAAVTVMPVSIDSLTASPPGPVAAGVEVELTWATSYAIGCTIDNGVGPVPLSGSVKVAPMRTTIYTLTASGLQQQSRSITVTVTG